MLSLVSRPALTLLSFAELVAAAYPAPHVDPKHNGHYKNAHVMHVDGLEAEHAMKDWDHALKCGSEASHKSGLLSCRHLTRSSDGMTCTRQMFETDVSGCLVRPRRFRFSIDKSQTVSQHAQGRSTRWDL